MKIVQGLGAVFIAVMGWGTIGLLTRFFICSLFSDLSLCRFGPASWFMAGLVVGVAAIVIVIAFVTVLYTSGAAKNR